MMQTSVIAIAPPVRRAIVAQARLEQPKECCGLLVGHRGRVGFAVPMRNMSASPTRYRIDDAAHLELRRVLRQFSPSLSILGVYHSHPAGPADPSPTDIDEAMYPEWAYIIVGLDRRRLTVRAFRIRMGAVQEIKIDWRT
jgi:[CysO sulfur-carrier protein]-S-L-cysteine hydrolase